MFFRIFLAACLSCNISVIIWAYGGDVKLNKRLLNYVEASCALRDWQGKAGEILFWDIRDPRLISKLDAYEQALFEIRRRLQLLLQKS